MNTAKHTARDAGVPESIILATWRSSFVAMSDEEVDNRNIIMDRGLEYMISWYNEQEWDGWNGKTIVAGKHTGTPYSQSECFTPNDFKELLDGNGYLNLSGSNPKVGQDCSGLVSYAFGNMVYNEDEDKMFIQRLSTENYDYIAQKGQQNKLRAGSELKMYDGKTRQININISKVGEYSSSSYTSDNVSNEAQTVLMSIYPQVAPGDALNRFVKNDGHIRLVLSNNGDSITVVEQTQPTTKIATYSYTDLAKHGYCPITTQ